MVEFYKRWFFKRGGDMLVIKRLLQDRPVSILPAWSWSGEAGEGGCKELRIGTCLRRMSGGI